MITAKTIHANIRMQQRGVSDSVIALIAQYGKSTHDNRGGVRVMIPKNRIYELMKKNSSIKSVLEKAKGIYLVISSTDDRLITTGHYTKK